MRLVRARPLRRFGRGRGRCTFFGVPRFLPPHFKYLGLCAGHAGHAKERGPGQLTANSNPFTVPFTCEIHRGGRDPGLYDTSSGVTEGCLCVPALCPRFPLIPPARRRGGSRGGAAAPRTPSRSQTAATLPALDSRGTRQRCAQTCGGMCQVVCKVPPSGTVCERESARGRVSE